MPKDPRTGIFTFALVDIRPNYASLSFKAVHLLPHGAARIAETGRRFGLTPCGRTDDVEETPRLDAVRVGEEETSDGTSASMLYVVRFVLIQPQEQSSGLRQPWPFQSITLRYL